MRIVIQTIGSRGDVEPFVALGLGLQAAGHGVTLATAPSFGAFVTSHELPYVPIRADYYDLLQDPATRAALRNPLRLVSLMREAVPPLMRAMLEDQAATAAGADLLVFHPVALGATHVAEAMRIPAVAAPTIPAMVPTAEFRMPLSPAWIPRWLNRRSYALIDAASRPYRGIVSSWRRDDLGLEPRRRGVGDTRLADGSWPLTLHAFSGHVLPRPADWPAEAGITGYWFLEPDAEWEAPAELTAFLDAGNRPVAVGFGSMVVDDAERLGTEIVAGIRAAGRRVVIVTGGSEFRPEPADDIHVIRSIPSHWLFPRSAAVICHGGVGTVAAALRAGRPTIVMPMLADQPFWGERVAALGAGPPAIALRDARRAWVEAAVRMAGQDETVEAAEGLGRAVRTEDGVKVAVKAIEAAAKRPSEQFPD